MKKAILFIASFFVLIVSLSAFTDRATAPVQGYNAPDIILSQNGSQTPLSAFMGKYVLLNFWTASDAESRLKNNMYDNFASGKDNLKLVSVNLDNSDALYREIIKLDRLNPNSQYHAEGSQATKIQQLYQLNGMLNSFLIDLQGRILTVNPDSQFLSDILS